MNEPSNGIPAAYQRKRRSFIGLNDGQVLQVAQTAYRAAQTLPAGSRARDAQWAKFDDAMAELAGRGLRHILAKIREREATGGNDSG